jgi:hypothetical protein
MLTFEQKAGLVLVAIMVLAGIVSLIAMRLIDKRYKIIQPESEESFKKRMAEINAKFELCCRICGSMDIRSDLYRMTCRECGSHEMCHRKKAGIK